MAQSWSHKLYTKRHAPLTKLTKSRKFDSIPSREPRYFEFKLNVYRTETDLVPDSFQMPSTSTLSSTSFMSTTLGTSMVNKKRRKAISPNFQTLEEPSSSRARWEPEKSMANYREVLAGVSGQAKGS